MEEKEKRVGNVGVDNKTDKIVYKEKKILRGLPKSIRQIGEATGKHKIYIEDYVVTYLNQLAHPTNSVARGAFLIGDWVHYDKEDVLFISGACEADNLSFNMSEVDFSDSAWTSIYEKVNEYFEDGRVVGWFLSRLGYSVKLTEQMRELHMQHFKEAGTVLYLMDALEQEDVFYLNENGKLVQQGGYYIYYERNTAMQNYLIENQAISRDVRNDKRIDYKDGQLLHSYHEIMAGRKESKAENRVRNLLYVTSAMLVLVFLAISISIFNNYDKLKSMQASLDQMVAKEAAGGSDSENVTLSVTEEILPNTEASAMAENGPGDLVLSTEDKGEQENSSTEQESAATEEVPETEPVSAATTESGDMLVPDNATAHADGQTAPTANIGQTNYYTVQPGDTLLSISEQIYHSGAYVDTLRTANEIGEGDLIYPGQKIVIPSIQ